MWATSLWGLIGLATAIVLTILGSRITGYENLLWFLAGAILIIAIIVGIWPLLKQSENPWPIAGMVAGAIVFLGSVVMWIYGPHFKTFPGFSAFTLVRLYDTPDLRKKYIFDFYSLDGAKVEFYLASDDYFRFRIADVHKEAYTLEIPVGNNGIPIDRYIFLYCEVALASRETVLRVLVDGREVRQRVYDFPIPLGSRKWKKITLFADNEGNNNAPFKIALFGFGHATMSKFQINSIQTRVNTYLHQIGSSILWQD